MSAITSTRHALEGFRRVGRGRRPDPPRPSPRPHRRRVRNRPLHLPPPASHPDTASSGFRIGLRALREAVAPHPLDLADPDRRHPRQLRRVGAGPTSGNALSRYSIRRAAPDTSSTWRSRTFDHRVQIETGGGPRLPARATPGSPATRSTTRPSPSISPGFTTRGARRPALRSRSVPGSPASRPRPHRRPPASSPATGRPPPVARLRIRRGPQCAARPRDAVLHVPHVLASRHHHAAAGFEGCRTSHRVCVGLAVELTPRGAPTHAIPLASGRKRAGARRTKSVEHRRPAVAVVLGEIERVAWAAAPAPWIPRPPGHDPAGRRGGRRMRRGPRSSAARRSASSASSAASPAVPDRDHVLPPPGHRPREIRQRRIGIRSR